ncbi:hypothetical protein GCM10010390_64570 [Streptomyces mordarskii]|uniref:HTH cro/C1-type domain-containing protein n=1 Tax=Streptomyces mordarskii TaxID=1226758 RepID=A0ABP3NXD9_9ACTN
MGQKFSAVTGQAVRSGICSCALLVRAPYIVQPWFCQGHASQRTESAFADPARAGRVTGTWTAKGHDVDITGTTPDDEDPVDQLRPNARPGAEDQPYSPPPERAPETPAASGPAQQAAEAFAAELIRLRNDRGLSQLVLARRMGYNKSYVTHVERCTQAPTQPFARQADLVLGSGEILSGLWCAYHTARRTDRRPNHAPWSVLPAPGTLERADGPQSPREGASDIAVGERDCVQVHRTNPPTIPIPRQLPPQPAHFTGRTAELSRLDALLDSEKLGRLSTVVVSAIAGSAGIGKTSLAVRWAHSAQNRFPDGQLYINLRGYDPDPPLTSSHALGFFLRSLGLPAERIPQDVEAMEGMYRSVLAGRRVLVVLDNAATPEQVRPLLPNEPGCVVVVTSRSRLSGLVARDGAHRVSLDVLTPDEAISLMREVIGCDRVNGELESVIQLARQCAYLPLALRVAAERVAGRPHLTVGDLVEELTVEHNRLDALAADDDEATAVRTVFSWSYHSLSPEAARVFRLLALQPGPDISLEAVAALAGVTPGEAGRQLDALVAVHLLAATSRGRFQFHDLLRAYAFERATTDEPAAERDTATRRLFEWYLHTAHAALFAFLPQHPDMPIDPVAPNCQPLEFADREHARRWFTIEHGNLLAVVRHAPAANQHTIGWQLPQVIDGYLAEVYHATERISVHQLGLAAAQHLGHELAQNWAYCHLGEAYEYARRYDKAIACFRHALEIAKKIGHMFGEAAALIELGSVCNKLGRYAEAADHSRQALSICRVMGHQRNEGLSLRQLGSALLGMGELDKAMIHLHQSLDISHKLGSPGLQAFALQSMAGVCRERGQNADAVDHLKKAAALYRAQRSDHDYAEILIDLGTVLSGMDRLCEARESWEEAHAILTELDFQQAALVSKLLEHAGHPRTSGTSDAAKDQP